jgi:hypothetical protein
MTRVTVTLLDEERDALHVLAQRERRDPRMQAALLIRRELERAGVLPIHDPRPADQSREVCQCPT